jgi:predicted nucleic acid-binding protein
VSALVFDTTCLSHFARADHLDLLDTITAGYERLVTNEVMTEIYDGIATYPALGHVIGVQWLSIVELDIFEVVAAVGYKADLGGDPRRDLGECATLAVARSRSGTAVIDDRDAATVGRAHEISVSGTISLIAGAVKRGVIDNLTASGLVDDLVATDMRLPVDGQSFLPWCVQHGLLP